MRRYPWPLVENYLVICLSFVCGVQLCWGRSQELEKGGGGDVYFFHLFLSSHLGSAVWVGGDLSLVSA